MTEKSVFREAWSPELTSQSFPVSCFWCRGFVPHRKWHLTLLAHQNTGKENRYRKTFLLHLSAHWERFNQANKKNLSSHGPVQDFLTPRRDLHGYIWATYVGVFPRTPQVRSKSKIYTLKWDDVHHHPFHIQFPPGQLLRMHCKLLENNIIVFCRFNHKSMPNIPSQT